MHQACLVRRPKAGQTLLQDGDRLRDGERPAAGQPLFERLALDVLHDEEVVPVVPADEVDRDDVGVLQPGDGGGLGVEAADETVVAGQLGGQHLDRDPPPQHFLVPEVHVSHPAVAEALDHPVMGQLSERRLAVATGAGAGHLSGRV